MKPNRKVNDIDDALSVLNRVADENSEDIKQMINRDYQRLKQTLTDLGPEISNRVHELKDATVKNLKQTRDEVAEFSKEKARAVDAQVKRNPWAVIGGAALGSVILGFFAAKCMSSKK